MLPEPRSLVDRALPVSHWETGVIVIVNQIDMLSIMMIHSFLTIKLSLIPFTLYTFTHYEHETKGQHDGNEIIFRREPSNHFNPLALH